MVEINIATDFSKFPGGRYRKNGKFSGEEFRDDRLLPALEGGDVVTVLIHGTAGYGSSFLEEAFGGAIRAGLTLEQLKKQLVIQATDQSFQTYVDEIWQYINEADQRKPVA